MLPAASPLTELLHRAKQQIQSTITQRDYESAKRLRDDCFAKADAIKAGLQAEVRQRHDTERRRLARARQAALKAVHETVEQELHQIERQWQERRTAFDARQQQRFEQYERTVRAREDTKPLVLSSYVRDLQQSEVKLASLHQYDDATQVRKKIQHLEVQERTTAEQHREERVQRALERRREAIEQDDSNFRAKVKNELQLALGRARREEARVQSKFDHIERDMRHAHSLELRKDPLQAPYERPAAFFPSSSQPLVAASSAAASMRGSQCLAQTQGSKLEVASLCDLYRDGIPESLRRSGEALRLGADPSAPKLDKRGLIDLSLPQIASR